MRIANCLIASLLLTTGACYRPAAQRAGPPCIDPQTPPGMDARTAAGQASIRAWATQHVTYDLANPPTGETRPLTIEQPPGSGNYVPGPVGQISPARCSHLNKPADLFVGQGRVIARIILPANQGYSKLGLPPGVSYLWVQGLNSATGAATAAIIPASPTVPVVFRKVTVHSYPSDYDRVFSEGRWIFATGDDYAWESCVQYGCCQIEHGQPGDTTAMGG